ncbi:hypothetical protein GCM10027160_11250 [Streptomyces calidiresistens]|uniref:Alpha/beta fold hydrolase n=1 Tax=Streptomyces calidiresistens TaxID=1485586 RepID=A0A7W3XX89_9ACTN|nr:alpha/beta fold hydrolase [Streptomyces calidiresistens]
MSSSPTSPTRGTGRRAAHRWGAALAGTLLTLAASLAAAPGVAAAGTDTAAAAGTRGHPGGRDLPPVVFVHGFTGDPSNWTAAMDSFEAAGWDRDRLFALRYDWSASNRESARDLADLVTEVRRTTGARRVAVVNHSMGGLVTQWYVKKLGGHRHVGHVASLAGAHHGTTRAVDCLPLTPCAEMIPGSAFLRALARGDETPGATRYGTWYSPCDGVIVPHESTRLRGAVNRELPCVDHIAFLTDPEVMAEIQRFVRRG